ncbi:MAG: hypothetical protein ACK58N_13275 [Synechocystis sp.]|jgi:hypothetical protein
MFKLPSILLTVLIGILSFLLTLLIHRPGQLWAPSMAQTVPAGGYTLLVEAVAQQVYEQFPELPKANTYRRQEGGEVEVDNTLISRFIRYHRDIKKRPTRYRLDWKLTLADYLEVNEPMSADRYPGFSTLQENPLDGDRQLIQALNRQQRQDLVDFLAEVYRPQTAPSTPEAPKPGEPSSPKPAVVTPDQPTLSQPGDAQLLIP